MKQAKVISVQKKDGSVDITSYRPIAVRRAICTKLIDMANDVTMAEHCEKYNISMSELKDALEDPVIFEEMWDMSFAHIVLPAVPEILKAWRDKCVAGDHNLIKLLLQVKGKTKPEVSTHVHLHNEARHLDGAALDAAIEEKFNMLNSLKKEAI